MRHSLVYGFGNLLNYIAAFLLLPVYTRYLTPTDYGIKELVGLSTDVIGILLATGISSAMYRFYFEYDDVKDRNEVISTTIIFLGLFGGLMVFLLHFTTPVMADYILDSTKLSSYFSISFTSMWFQMLVQVGYDYLRANQRSLTFISLSFSKLILSIGLNVYFVIFKSMGVMGILVSTLITAVLMSLILTFPLLIRVGFRFSFSKAKEMLKFGLPMVPSQLGAFVVHLSDRFFLKAFTSIADTGIYSLGYRFGTIPNNFVSGPFNQVWFPRRLELYKKPNSERIFGQVFTYFLFAMFFAGLGISILTKDVLRIISAREYWEAYRIVPIIVLATTVFSLHYHFNIGIMIRKKTKYLAYINFSNGCLILILNYFMIKPFGVYGAAYATLIAFIYKVTLTYYFSTKYYKIYFELLRIAKLTGVAAFLFGVSTFVDFNSIIMDVSIKSLLLLSFPLMLYSIGFFHPQEKEYILSLLRPGIVALRGSGRA